MMAKHVKNFIVAVFTTTKEDFASVDYKPDRVHIDQLTAIVRMLFLGPQ